MFRALPNGRLVTITKTKKTDMTPPPQQEAPENRQWEEQEERAWLLARNLTLPRILASGGPLVGNIPEDLR